MNFEQYCLILKLFFVTGNPLVEKKPGEAIKYRDSAGRTLAHLAVLHWDMHLFEYLTKNGMDLASRDNRGDTVLDYTRKMGHARL